ncbi:MAG: hypothetical protein AAF346_04310 [Pseudomonadota bacterium]
MAQQAANESPAEPVKWEVVAKQNIRFRGLIRRIKLKNPSQRVLGLKVRTRGRRMTFSSIKVRFQDGKTHHARRRIRLRSGEVSSAFAVSQKGRLVDEIILIPDVSAPRRRAIGVEILAHLALEPTQREAVTAEAKEVPQQPEAKPVDVQATSRVANQVTDKESAAPLREVEEAAKPSLEPSDTTQKVMPAKKASASANPAAKPIVKDVTTAPVNRLAATSTDVGLPSQRPKVDSGEEPKPPPKIDLGTATKGGELLLAAGNVSRQGDPTSFEIQSRPNRFARIRLHLAAQNLRVDKVIVHYDGGTRHTEAFDVVLQRNTHSRWMTINSKLAIVKVTVHPETSQPGKGVARIEVLAEPIVDALLPAEAAKNEADGWLLIAAQSGRVIKSFDGQMPVARTRGGFSQLRIVRIGRLPRPTRMALQVSDAGAEAVELPLSKSDMLELSQTQRGPIDRVRLRFPGRTINRVSSTGIFQLWARY